VTTVAVGFVDKN